VSRRPEDRGGELRALFFESASELLQSLNEAGLELEAHPADEEVIRRVRRAVHTLKGDSAACGFQKLSELAHELEDVLSPQIAQSRGAQLAEVVLSAADSFEAMLAAYKRRVEPPAVDALHAMIRSLLESAPASGETPSSPRVVAPRFEWTEYEQLMISEAVHRGETVYNVALRVDPNSLMRAAAFQLIRNVLHGCGTVIALRPEDNVAAATVEVVEAAVASRHQEDKIAQRCRIPSIVSDVFVERARAIETAEHELLGDLLDAQAEIAAKNGEQTENSGGATPGLAGSAATAVAESSLRVDASRIDAVMNLVGELIIGKSMLNRTLSEFDQRHARDPVRAKLADAVAFQSRVLDELHKCVLKIRMVPVEQLFRRLPRIVRDVAKARKKEIAIEMAGQNTDLDKSVLDALADPMAHLVRNAADHGIETPEERLANGKSARGTIRLDAYHQGNQVVIEVADDGRGINHEKLMRKAVEAGIVSSEEMKSLSHDEILRLIFHPGLTTAEEVTEISGRGVGMDVVKTVMDRLKGRVVVESEPGRGSKFQLIAPLTLASIQALMFRVENQHYAVPLDSVIEIARATDSEIHRIDGHEVIRLREQVLSVVRLDQLISAAPVSKKTRHFVVTIGAGSHRFGLIVDSLVGEEELVIKAFEDRLVASELVSGASILGDGTVVLILNVPAVVSHLSQKRLVEVPA
jgi:two-component system, chemotaxis family, sensor kinase CheA